VVSDGCRFRMIGKNAELQRPARTGPMVVGVPACGRFGATPRRAVAPGQGSPAFANARRGRPSMGRGATGRGRRAAWYDGPPSASREGGRRALRGSAAPRSQPPRTCWIARRTAARLWRQPCQHGCRSTTPRRACDRTGGRPSMKLLPAPEGKQNPAPVPFPWPPPRPSRWISSSSRRAGRPSVRGRSQGRRWESARGPKLCSLSRIIFGPAPGGVREVRAGLARPGACRRRRGW
jgi:hypothetical protein